MAVMGIDDGGVAGRSVSSLRYHWVAQPMSSAGIPASSAMRLVPRLQAWARMAA